MLSTRLVLHPQEPLNALPDRQDVIWQLKELGLLGKTFGHGGKPYFHPGKGFYALIGLIGCSPVVPPTLATIIGESKNSQLNYAIEIPNLQNDICFGGNPQNRPPKCKQCKTVTHNWQAPINVWRANQQEFHWQCPNCHHTGLIYQMDWRHVAGFYRFCINIYGVHEGEAVPTDPLLTALQELIQKPWDFFYSGAD